MQMLLSEKKRIKKRIEKLTFYRKQNEQQQKKSSVFIATENECKISEERKLGDFIGFMDQWGCCCCCCTFL